LLARGGSGSGARPCIAIGEASVQIAATPWQAQWHVGFTDDPAEATVRVQIVDRAEAADFTVVDDIDTTDAGGCAISAATRFIAISTVPAAGEPVIYLSDQGDADYTIFVSSRHFTPRDAAALIVGARGGHGDRHHMAAAAF
jgi:hypothetical protein